MTRNGAKQTGVVIVSGYHDYRSKRKVDLHFIADELKKKGAVSFFSMRYSYLTRWREDPRHDLWTRANCMEWVDGVSCYLWRTILHPIGLPARAASLERLAFQYYSRNIPAEMAKAIVGATTVLIESGIAIIFIPSIKRLNPAARIIYMASDDLDTIGQAQFVRSTLSAASPLIAFARVPSPYLAPGLPAAIPWRFIPHAVDKHRLSSIGHSPFRAGTLNAVSVGSMLFDAGFFETAAPLFPQVTFHVIGSGHSGGYVENVIYYEEMAFEETLPFLKFSNFAIAPYGAGVAPYLTHTSMKLAQYNALGIPAVCPDVVAGEGLGRFGYRVGEAASIRSAIQAALAAGPITPAPHLDWNEVSERLVSEEGVWSPS